MHPKAWPTSPAAAPTVAPSGAALALVGRPPELARCTTLSAATAGNRRRYHSSRLLVDRCTAATASAAKPGVPTANSLPSKRAPRGALFWSSRKRSSRSDLTAAGPRGRSARRPWSPRAGLPTSRFGAVAGAAGAAACDSVFLPAPPAARACQRLPAELHRRAALPRGGRRRAASRAAAAAAGGPHRRRRPRSRQPRPSAALGAGPAAGRLAAGGRRGGDGCPCRHLAGGARV